MDNLKRIINTSIALTKANFKEQNEGSYLGILLQIIIPFFTLIVLILVFSSKLGDEIPFYSLYILIGVIIFNFFTATTTISVNTIKFSGHLIKNIKFPYISLIISKILLNLIAHISHIIVLTIFVLMVTGSIIGLIFYPVILLALIFFTLGISLILTIIKVYSIDISAIWPFISLMWWFATPIFYSIEENSIIYKLNLINPLFYIITVARKVIIYNQFPEAFLILGMLFFSLLSLFIGLLIFNNLENKFAEKL